MIELTAVVGVIIGLVEAIKRTTFIDSKFFPLIALFLGVAWYTLTGDMGIAENVFSGVVAGLSAVGLYDHKNIVK